MSAEDAWMNISKTVAARMIRGGVCELRIILIGEDGEFQTEVTPDEAKSDFVKLAELNAELVAALERVMSWVDNWSPNFTDDPEWPYSNAKVRAAIAKAKEGAE